MAVFDELIAAVGRQGETVRQSAAALGTMRNQLKREVEKYRARLADINARCDVARGQSDATAVQRLQRDADETARLLRQCEEGLTHADVDARQLIEAAEAIATQLADLKAERLSARTRMTSSSALQSAAQQRADDFDRLLKLDKARDDIERAHALAELYRDDSQTRKK